MLIGGGLDIKVSKHIALRPIGADYYFTRLPTFITGDDTDKNYFRYSAGVNFLFEQLNSPFDTRLEPVVHV